jgi:hypothetical protein
VTSDDAVLNYATPRRDAQTPRADWLAVFSFLWAFAVSPAGVIVLLQGWEQASTPLRFALLVLTPAVAVVAGYVATERGAPWDSPYRATGLAVCAVPVAWLMMAVGTVFCLGLV